MARRSVQCGGTAPEDEVCDHGTAEIPCGICIQGQFIFWLPDSLIDDCTSRRVGLEFGGKCDIKHRKAACWV